jgi:hypothetical protein
MAVKNQAAPQKFPAGHTGGHADPSRETGFYGIDIRFIFF